jgi:hypothetical protein
MTKMIDAALALRKKYGWKLFPARMKGGKKWSWMSAEFAPGGENWGMSDDPEQVRKNFSRPRWRDRCGLGVPTGAVNRIFVIEADTVAGHGVDGLAALRKLERKYGKLPKTLMAVSPSGSVHRYYRYPDNGMKITSAALVHGVDIKGDGGMVVAPPSRRGDGVYRWRNSLPIVAAPRWLLQQVQEKERAPREADPYAQFANHVRQTNMAELRLAAAMLPNTLKTSRDEWVRNGLALWSATDGSEDGYQIFAAWSRRWPGYNAKNTRKFWDTVKKMPDEITAGTIYHLAEEAVPNWRERMYCDRKVIALIKEFYELLGEPEAAK